MSKKFRIWALVTSVFLSFILYGNTFKGEFVWDDVYFTGRAELGTVAHLPHIFFESILPDSQQAGLYRPFTMFTFALNLLIHGKTTFGFHLTSILLNALAGWLLLLVVYKLFKNKTLAIFAAFFFAFLPIHTEAIALMKARDELLGTVFGLWSWLLFIKATEEKLNKKYLFLSALLFFIALLSKEFAVMMPAVFYLVYWVQKKIPFKKIFTKELWWGMLYFGSFFIVYLIMRHIALPEKMFGDDDIGPLSNVLIMPSRWVALQTAFKIFFIYIEKIFYPINLTASYHFKAVTLVKNILYSWRGLIGLFTISIFLFFSFWKKTKTTAFGIGIIIFLILYIPTSQIFFIGGDIVGERWMYLPTIGLSISMGAIFLYFYQVRKTASIIIFSIILIGYSCITIPRNKVWRNSYTLFTSMIEDSPDSVRGYSGLAQYYLEHEMYTEAFATVNKGFMVTNQEPNLYVVAAALYYKQGKFDKAEELIHKALELDTFSSAAVLNYARILFAQKKYERALDWFNEYISQLPENSLKISDKLLYATLLSKQGQYAKSNEYIHEKIGESNEYDIRFLLAVNYFALGEREKTFASFPEFPLKTNKQKIEELRKFMAD